MAATELESAVRASLWITAPINLIAGFGFAFPTGLIGSLLGLPAEASSFYTHLAGMMVGLFGGADTWLAAQPSLSRPLLFLGAFGKLCAFVLAFPAYLGGSLAGLLAFVMTGDLLFAILWFYYLWGRDARR